MGGAYDQRPNYRGAADDMSMEDLQKLLAADAQVPLRPTYRGDFSCADGPAPSLCKQKAFFQGEDAA